VEGPQHLASSGAQPSGPSSRAGIASCWSTRLWAGTTSSPAAGSKRAIVTADLDDDEQALGLRPEWVPIVEALEVNRELVASGRASPWAPREVVALEALRPRLW
jgi:hypothetical protein